jgi:S1-C subfamily serine protease
VVAVGAPYGVRGAPSASFGAVAAVGRRIGSVRGMALRDMIETDAPVAPGAAGGALCDQTGAVVGLTAMADGSGAGFATPIDDAWAVAEALMAEGVVHRVWLGIEGSDVAATAEGVTGLTSAGGVRIERVLEGSPAAAAGLEAGDQVVGIDDHGIGSMDDLVVALRGYEPGDAVDVRVDRAGTEVVVPVTLAER